MEMGSIEKKTKTSNSRFIYYLLNHEIILDYILQIDLDLLKVIGFIVLLQCHNCNHSWTVFGEEYANGSEHCGKFFQVVIKFLNCFLGFG